MAVQGRFRGGGGLIWRPCNTPAAFVYSGGRSDLCGNALAGNSGTRWASSNLRCAVREFLGIPGDENAIIGANWRASPFEAGANAFVLAGARSSKGSGTSDSSIVTIPVGFTYTRRRFLAPFANSAQTTEQVATSLGRVCNSSSFGVTDSLIQRSRRPGSVANGSIFEMAIQILESRSRPLILRSPFRSEARAGRSSMTDRR